MKKCLVFMLVLLFVASVCSAWEFGLKGGLSAADLKFDPDIDTIISEAEEKGFIGHFVGAWASYPLGDNMGILGELKITKYGDRYDISDTDPEVHLYFNICMIEMPVLFYYMPAEKVRVFAGPMLSYLTKADERICQEIPSEDFDVETGYVITDSLKKISFSLVFGAQYWLLPRMFADIRYNMGMTDLSDGLVALWTPSETEIKTGSIEFGLGYMF